MHSLIIGLNTTNLVAGQGCAVTSIKSQVYLIKRFLVCFRSHQEIPLEEAAIQRFLRVPHNANLTARAGTAALYRLSRYFVSRVSFNLRRRSHYPTIEAVIARNNRLTSIGRRDYAILLLLARLGLHAL
jgi:hypothetical protein